MDMNVMMGRLMRVLRFDATVYKEIAADAGAFPGAIVIVVVAAIISAIGSYSLGVVGVIVVAVLSIVSFFIYAAVAALVAKMLFQGKTDFNEMARTLGYAFIWNALGILALLAGVLSFLGWIAAAISGFLALRESAEFDNTKAIITIVIAVVVAGVINFFVQAPVLLMLGVATAQ